MNRSFKELRNELKKENPSLPLKIEMSYICEYADDIDEHFIRNNKNDIFYLYLLKNENIDSKIIVAVKDLFINFYEKSNYTIYVNFLDKVILDLDKEDLTRISSHCSISGSAIKKYFDYYDIDLLRSNKRLVPSTVIILERLYKKSLLM